MISQQTLHHVLSMETTNFKMRRKIKNTLQSFLLFYFLDDANIANLCNKYFSWIYLLWYGPSMYSIVKWSTRRPTFINFLFSWSVIKANFHLVPIIRKKVMPIKYRFQMFNIWRKKTIRTKAGGEGTQFCQILNFQIPLSAMVASDAINHFYQFTKASWSLLVKTWPDGTRRAKTSVVHVATWTDFGPKIP